MLTYYLCQILTLSSKRRIRNWSSTDYTIVFQYSISLFWGAHTKEWHPVWSAAAILSFAYFGCNAGLCWYYGKWFLYSSFLLYLSIQSVLYNLLFTHLHKLLFFSAHAFYPTFTHTQTQMDALKSNLGFVSFPGIFGTYIYVFGTAMDWTTNLLISAQCAIPAELQQPLSDRRSLLLWNKQVIFAQRTTAPCIFSPFQNFPFNF